MVKYLLVLGLLVTNNLFGQNNAEFVSQVVPESVSPGENFNITVTFKNTGTTTWSASDLYRLGTQNPQDNTIWMSSNRVALPNNVPPGSTVSFHISLTAPVNEGIYALQWRMVQDGVEWFGQQSEVVYYSILANFSDSLLVEGNHFSVSSHIVSTSFFCWYGPGEWQLNGPWIPLNGRDSWDGSISFWKRMIKEAMAANIDVFYVELIPVLESNRVAFFQALMSLRTEGWNVPKVCPFLDTEITYSILGYNGDCATEAGKDELISHYIRFYKQYYAANPDRYADDYIYTQDHHPVLDIWHIQNKIDNYSDLTRDDVTNRLKAEFGAYHPVFNNDIKMINNAYSPCFNFCDERIYQFEMQEYKIDKTWNGIKSSLLKPGYWDQNVRDPGFILKRDGGSHYKDAWNAVNNDASIDRVYIESFNEYDEGSGIYATKTDTIFRISSNTNTDSWSATNDPWEYIKTTAAGAARFNDFDELDARIIWQNIPDTLISGESFDAAVVVQNAGNHSWTNAGNIKFGQHDNDQASFGDRRFLIDDSRDEIPVYGGIFRGRTKTFHVKVIAPDTPGTYTTHWGMLKEGETWFGDTLTKNIVVENPSAINEQELKKRFRVYPNPIPEGGRLHMKGIFGVHDNIIVYTITGQKVNEILITSSGRDLYIDTDRANMKKGIYIIKFVSGAGAGSFTKKIVVGNSL